MMTPGLDKTLHRALELAAGLEHEMITIEHLLLALLQDDDALTVLKGCRVDCAELGKDLTRYVEHEIGAKNLGRDPLPTQSFQRVLLRAALQGQHS
ncbi:MAG: ATP-dependent Clp protease ATP-binding subunit ClpA, partial [Alphaproteobacteria bacterium]|nr:ATP-dependent Clp protease ATP-binding subunit ClpA [Alphaproteobacteria bacterium]